MSGSAYRDDSPEEKFVLVGLAAKKDTKREILAIPNSLLLTLQLLNVEPLDGVVFQPFWSDIGESNLIYNFPWPDGVGVFRNYTKPTFFIRWKQPQTVLSEMLEDLISVGLATFRLTVFRRESAPSWTHVVPSSGGANEMFSQKEYENKPAVPGLFILFDGNATVPIPI